MVDPRADESWRSFAAATMAVAATYVFFLLFAQFAFLEHLRGHLDAAGVKLAMAAMGTAGAATSLAVAWLVPPTTKNLRRWFLAAGATAVFAPTVTTPGVLVGLSAAIGAATAGVTVSLAVLLPGWTSGRLGRSAGAGTALAYLLCNLPGIFDASVTSKAAVAALAAAAGVIALVFVPDRSSQAAQPAGTVRLWILAPGFLALVWLDSAVFAVVQQSELVTSTWGTGQRSLLQGGVHAGAALVAGVLLDRGRLGSLLVAAFFTFAVAFAWLDPQSPYLSIAGPIYAVGISLYSTALVVAPARTSGGSLALRAGLLFGIAGWIGSALGVGMAQDLGSVPQWFVIVAGAAVVVVALAGWGQRRVRLARETWLPGALATGAMLVGGAVVDSGARPARETVEVDAVARGRLVYIAEGCVGCHSQYVRPSAADQALYGPHRPLDRAEHPPLLGLRRQGPDLSNVGARRSAEWLAAHLVDPRRDHPDSVMPGYPSLFEGEPPKRGDDLVAYLSSLGPSSREASAP